MNILLFCCLVLGIILLIGAIFFFGASALGCLVEGFKYILIGAVGVLFFWFIIRGLWSIIF